MRARIDRIEALIHQDTGRGFPPVIAATRGGLWGAVSALAAAPGPVGILTGFFVPRGTPPAAETDGPAGAALLALAFSRVGIPCRLLTDTACRSACEAALAGAGLDSRRGSDDAGAGDVRAGDAKWDDARRDDARVGDARAGDARVDDAGLPMVLVDAVPPDASPDQVTAAWRAHGMAWMIAIERCGPGADGKPRNMRGEDVGAHAAPLENVFTAGPWRTIAIGDGGNEVGMGSLPPGLIAATVPFGDTIACVTPATHLIAAGVSHWGAYALIAGLAVVKPAWREALLACLDPAIERRILETLVAQGPAVDGVTLDRALTIDGLGLDTHGAKREQLKDIAVWSGAT